MIFGDEPIDWRFINLRPDPRPAYIRCLVAISIILVVYFILVFLCDRYLRRRKKKIYRYYKVDVIYKDEKKEPETLYIETFGKIDICMFFSRFAKTKIERIKHPEEYDEEFICLNDIVDEIHKEETQKRDQRIKEINERIEEEKRQKRQNRERNK